MGTSRKQSIHCLVQDSLTTICKSYLSRVYRKSIKGNQVVQMKRLPPTPKAAIQHLKRAYYQVKVFERMCMFNVHKTCNNNTVETVQLHQNNH